MYIWPKPYYMQCPYKDRFDSVTEKELHTMSRAAFIENVAKRGNISKAESKRIVDLVLGEIEAGVEEVEEGRPLHHRQLRHLHHHQAPGAQRQQSANGRSDPDQSLQGSEVPAVCRAEEGRRRLIPG